MSDRDELAAILLRALSWADHASREPYIGLMDPDGEVVIDGHVNLKHAADEILARWRLVPVEEHECDFTQEVCAYCGHVVTPAPPLQRGTQLKAVKLKERWHA